MPKRHAYLALSGIIPAIVLLASYSCAEAKTKPELKARVPLIEPVVPKKPLEGSVLHHQSMLELHRSELRANAVFGNARINSFSKGAPVMASHDGERWRAHKYIPILNDWITTRAPETSRIRNLWYQVVIGDKFVAIFNYKHGAVDLGDAIHSDKAGQIGIYDAEHRAYPVGVNGVRRLNSVIGGGWLCNTETGEWTKIPKQIPSCGHISAIGDQVIAWGGPEKGEILDVKTMKWTKVPDAPVEWNRYRAHYAVCKNKFVIWGGHPNAMRDGAVYDISSRKWTKMSPAPDCLRFSHGDNAASWGRYFLIIAAGRNQSALYDTTTHRWRILPDLPFRAKPGSSWTAIGTVVSGDKLLAWCGKYKLPPYANPFDAAHPYDPLHSSDARIIKAPYSPFDATKAAVLDLKTMRWSAVPDCPLPPRNLAWSCPAKDGAYIYSGWDPNESQPRPKVDKNSRLLHPNMHNHIARTLVEGVSYSFATGRWTKIKDIPGSLPGNFRYNGKP